MPPSSAFLYYTTIFVKSITPYWILYFVLELLCLCLTTQCWKLNFNNAYVIFWTRVVVIELCCRSWTKVSLLNYKNENCKKGAISWKCLNTFVRHCLNVKCCYCTDVEHCVTMILLTQIQLKAESCFSLNKNRRKAIFNWAAKGAIFSEGRGRLYTLRLP